MLVRESDLSYITEVGIKDNDYSKTLSLPTIYLQWLRVHVL